MKSRPTRFRQTRMPDSMTVVLTPRSDRRSLAESFALAARVETIADECEADGETSHANFGKRHAQSIRDRAQLQRTKDEMSHRLLFSEWREIP